MCKVQGELVSVERMLHMQEKQTCGVGCFPETKTIYALNTTSCQDKIFETPTVLLSGHVSGEEEVPVGVQARVLD